MPDNIPRQGLSLTGTSFLCTVFLKVNGTKLAKAMARKRNLAQAVGYVRTSSAANVGEGKDSERRQRLAIERFGDSAGFEAVAWFADPAVSGSDPLESRPGFAALLDRVENNGVRVVLVEDASRFARDLVAQELGLIMLIKRGMRVITASGDDMTDSTDPSRIMMRQIAGSFAQYEKNRLVRKLREARERSGNLGGRKSYAEARPIRSRLLSNCMPRDCLIARSAPHWPRKVMSALAANRTLRRPSRR
jgi:DNA invertase Pin-like site-specific DNA recombinase